MENHPIEIVRLPVEAWQDYKAIRLEALKTEAQAFGSSYADMLQKPDSFWQSRLADAAEGTQSWLLFARQGQRLVGLIGAFVDENDPQAAHVISVYVNREARGQGVSRQMMRAILDVLVAAGKQKAFLTVMVDQKPALHLYQSFGFQVVSTLQGHLMGNGEYHDEYVMEKRLEE